MIDHSLLKCSKENPNSCSSNTGDQPTGQEPSQDRLKTQLLGAESSCLRPQCYHVLERQAENRYYLKFLIMKVLLITVVSLFFTFMSN